MSDQEITEAVVGEALDRRILTSSKDWLRVWERVPLASLDGQAPQILRRESIWRGWQTW